MFPLGGLLAGITPLWASEIEPFPIRVTTKRLPSVKHLGDISAVDGAEIDGCVLFIQLHHMADTVCLLTCHHRGAAPSESVQNDGVFLFLWAGCLQASPLYGLRRLSRSPSV